MDSKKETRDNAFLLESKGVIQARDDEVLNLILGMGMYRKKQMRDSMEVVSIGYKDKKIWVTEITCPQLKWETQEKGPSGEMMTSVLLMLST